MHELEMKIRGQLLSGQLAQVKDGLSNILYWGHFRAGYRDSRVKKFRDKVNDILLKKAAKLFPVIVANGIIQIKELKLPQFSNLSFISKVRMFLDPAEYVVLDRSLMRIRPLSRNFKQYPTCIPATKHNASSYDAWALFCRKVSDEVSDDEHLRAVDIERGFFYLIDQGQAAIAEKILLGLNPRL